MKVALTQMDIIWEDKAKNKIQCERMAGEASEQGASLIIFPELTLTGFSMDTAKIGEMAGISGNTAGFFFGLSEKYGIDIIFGMAEMAGEGKAYNKSVLVQNGKLHSDYRKIHPFSYGGEDRYYLGGNDINSVSYKEAWLSMFVCYDLRFPTEFQYASEKSEIITVIANWPESRLEHWYALLKARAIENQSFVLGVNRVGKGGGLSYAASSVVYSPYGKRLTEECGDEIIYAYIDVREAAAYRREFPVKRDNRRL